ncbi:hypothetical protein FRC12_013869, partial [Ceratobasidium sp. 428]
AILAFSFTPGLLDQLLPVSFQIFLPTLVFCTFFSMYALNTFTFGAASLFALVGANHGHLLPRSHHHGVAKRGQTFSGQATYYAIVSLNAPQFGNDYPGPHCFKTVKICSGDDQCHFAKIVDKCEGCAYGSLDMSESLFKQFYPTDKGVFRITWNFVGDGEPDEPEKPDPPKPSKKPDPPKTSKEPEPEPEPTTTSKRHTTTSKPKPETTPTPEPTTSKSTSTTSEPTTTTSTSEAKSTTSTSEIPSSTAETSATPSSTTGAGSGSGSGSKSSSGNLEDMNQLMLAFGKLMVAAQKGY